MATPYQHAQSSAKKFGGNPSDYIELHLLIDSSKLHFPFWMHRAITHNSFFIGICEKIIGPCIKNSEGREIGTRLVAEQHIREDCNNKIPTIKEWLLAISNKEQNKWMNGPLDIE
jgi:hypothetical protein